MNIENNLGELINIKVKLNEELSETCTIGLVSLDDKKLENSEKLLLTIVGKVRNTNQIWNDDRTSTYKAGWGKAPTLVQFIEIEAILKFKEDEKPKIFSINNYGELNKEFILSGNKNNWILKSDDENPTLNYYIIRTIPKVNNNEIAKLKENTDSYIIIICLIIFVIIIGLGVMFYIRKYRKQNINDVEEGFLKNKI